MFHAFRDENNQYRVHCLLHAITAVLRRKNTQGSFATSRRNVHLSKPSERSEQGFGSSEWLTYVCGTLCLATCLAQFASNLQRLMRGGARSTSAKKIILKKKFNFFLMIFFACNLTLTHLCTCDDSLGFEDCRVATHLLNLLYAIL